MAEPQPISSPASAELEKVNVRSDELQEVIGMIPHWIIRRGISIILAVLVLLLAGSWIFRYPDVVPATVVVTTKNPAAVIVARSSGKIQNLFVSDGQIVAKGDYLGILETTANFQHVQELQKQLEQIHPFLGSFKPPPAAAFSKDYQLGELQNSYEQFLKSYAEYLHFRQLDQYSKKIVALREQLVEYNQYCDQLSMQIKNLEEEKVLSEKQYERAKTLFQEGIISQTDLENARSANLQKNHSYESARTTLTQAHIHSQEMEQTIQDLDIQNAQQSKSLQLVLNQNYNTLASALLLWEQTYVLKTPISGKVTFTKFWSVNQNVSLGEKVISIVPQEKMQVIGRVVLPIQGSGKVKVGQKVRIKLANYPYMEFGIVWGKISSKSLMPVDNIYVLEVELPDGLKTSYGKSLEFTQEMQGTAEIVTENKRLITRLLSPFKLLLSQNRG